MLWGVDITTVPVGTVIKGYDGEDIVVDDRTIAANGREMFVSESVFKAIKAASFQTKDTK